MFKVPHVTNTIRNLPLICKSNQHIYSSAQPSPLPPPACAPTSHRQQACPRPSDTHISPCSCSCSCAFISHPSLRSPAPPWFVSWARSNNTVRSRTHPPHQQPQPGSHRTSCHLSIITLKINYTITQITAASLLYLPALAMCGFIISMDGVPQIGQSTGVCRTGNMIDTTESRL